MKKFALAFFIFLLICTIGFIGLYVYFTHINKADPVTQAYLEARDPKVKMILLERILDKDEYSRWAWLDDAAELAFEIDDYAKAEKYALESLAISSKHVSDWNYGNAIHNANSVLGRIRLVNDDTQEAKTYLLAAATSKGSPQLNSFGPDLTLANALLKRGEKETVLTYLSSISTFWEMDNGCIKSWIEQINRDETPEMNNHQC